MEYKEDRYRKRVEILDGFIKAVEHPRETMEIMIGNNNPRKGLQELFSLSEEQAQAILDMRIRVFGEERKKLYEDRRDCEDRLRIFRMVPKEERETWETISKAYYKLVKNFYSIK